MHYTIESDIQVLSKSDAIILGFFDNAPLPNLYEALDPKLQEIVRQLKMQTTQKHQWRAQLYDENKTLMIINLGKIEQWSPKEHSKAVELFCEFLKPASIQHALVHFSCPKEQNLELHIKQHISGCDQALYQFKHFKSDNKPLTLKQITYFHTKTDERLIHEINAINQGVRMTRDLGNTPANICTPTYLAATAQELAQQFKKLDCKVLGQTEIENLRMGAFLAVSAGSEQEPKLIELNYRNGGKKKPIVIVGKGVTFDSGGLCIKPSQGMQEMKYDMCGAASVIGVVKACAEMDLKVNLIGVIASCENMINGKATRPGDVVTSMSGQSVEIINTDAEGRLILADALTYVEQFKPKFVVDIATLTGAIIVALGSVYSGLMTSDDDLAESFQKAAQASNDRCWRMPLDDEYQTAVDSHVADMLNSAFDRSAGSTTAACFLSRFTKAYPWAHLDIAGTAWKSGKKCTASGRPVPLLVELIKQHCHAS